MKLVICTMFKFGRLKTVEERKITGSYGRRRAVNPVLINVWELETSEGFPTTAHLSNRSVWFTLALSYSSKINGSSEGFFDLDKML
jgi:hypothetical protein